MTILLLVANPDIQLFSIFITFSLTLLFSLRLFILVILVFSFCLFMRKMQHLELQKDNLCFVIAIILIEIKIKKTRDGYNFYISSCMI